MKKASKYLIGAHDFSGFTDATDAKSTRRQVLSIKIVSNGEKVRITYYGNGFLYHMVRIMTGTLLEVGTGKRDPRTILEAIKTRDRSKAGFLAPARGLFLRKVYY